VKYIIDSNIFIYAAAGISQALLVLEQVDSSSWKGYSAISRLEVMGYKKFSEDEETKMNALLSCFMEQEVTSSVIDEAIRLRKQSSIRSPDAIIAATAIVNGATLVTRNKSDFTKIDGLSILNPFESP
jgi:predicted nucleic acid-binding protein